MRATARLFRHAVRVTLFTRPQCSLCEDAKAVLSKVQQRRPFEYTEVNVLEREQGKWKDLYAWDTPVVHTDPTGGDGSQFETTAASPKLMHRFTEAQLEEKMDEALRSAT